MAKALYVGVSGIAKKAKKIYVGGTDGKAKKVKKIYIGDASGKARLAWSGSSSGFVWWAGYSYNRDQKVEAGSALGAIDATLDVMPSKSNSYCNTVPPVCAWQGKIWTSKDNYVYYSTDAGRTWTSIYNSQYWFIGFFPENNDYLGLLALNSNSYGFIHRIAASAQTTIDLDTGGAITSTTLECAVQCGEYIYFSYTVYNSSSKQTIVYKLTDKTRTTIYSIGLQRAAASSSRIVAVYQNQSPSQTGLGYVNKGGTTMTMVDTSYSLPGYNNQVAATYWKNKFWFYRPNLTYYSTDGTSWSSQASAPSKGDNYIVAVSNSNPEKMYMPYYGGNNVSQSERYGYNYTSDGLTWTVVKDSTTYRFFKYILDNPDV